MRASYVLLVVLAALLSYCDATAATTGVQVQAGASQNELLSKRALRLHGATTETETREDDEERTFSLSKLLGLKKASEKAPSVGKALEKVASLEKAPAPNLFLADDIQRMTRDRDFKIDRWEKWYVEQLSLGNIRKELEKLGLKNNQDYKNLLVDYINLYKARADDLIFPAAEKAGTAEKKIHFGTNTETTIEKIDAVMAEKAKQLAKKLEAQKLLKKAAEEEVAVMRPRLA